MSPYYIGAPVLKLDTCSKSTLIFICILQDGNETLQWDLSKFNVDIVSDRIVYLSSDKIGLELQHIEDGVHIELNLTSRSPLTSTLTANTSNLYGTTVFCLDEIDSHESANRASIAVQGM